MSEHFFSEEFLLLLETALDLPAAEQESFIASDRVPDALKADLARMMRGLNRSQILRAPPNRLITEILPGTDRLVEPGLRIGPYRLERLIGEGGMASVWMAERDDGRIVQQVAIKCLKSGLGTPVMRRYFLQEQQVLARMRHPNIASMYDAGLTPNGVPYIVMEYVKDGCPIDEYCDRERLGITQRVALFQKVCTAVQYAHQNLVIHRDLKPSNILVNDVGEPKLLDFGIAKLLGKESDGLTHTGLKPLTPNYAAPEQLDGGGITTSTDVFSLGLVLYELLCGIKAQTWDGSLQQAAVATDPPSLAMKRAGKKRADAAGKAILAAIAEKRGANLEALVKAIQGDLDTIALHALQRDPHRRYPTVSELNDDLNRWRQYMPIKARKDALPYRCGKFLRRHRTAALSALIIAIILVAATTVSLHQAWRATTEARRAHSESARSLATKRFLIDLLEVADSGVPRERMPSTKTLLKEGADRVKNGLKNQPELKIELLLLLGRVHSNLGSYAEAKPLLEQAQTLSEAYLPKSDPRWLDVRVELARLLYRIWSIDKSSALLANAVDRYAQAKGRENHSYAGALIVQADLFGAKELRAQQLQKLDEAVKVLRLSGNRAAQLDEAELKFGRALAVEGKHAQAESILRAVYAARAKRHGEQHAKFAEAATYLGDALRLQGKLAEALALLKTAVAVNEKTLRLPSERLVNSYLRLGFVYSDLGDPQNALHYLGKVQSTESIDPANREYYESTIKKTSMPYLFHAYITTGQYEKAQRLIPEYRRLVVKYHGDASNEMLEYSRQVGNFFLVQDKFVEARKSYYEALEIAKRVPPSNLDEPELSFILLSLAMAENELKLPNAGEHAAKALLILGKYYPPHHGLIIRAQFEILQSKPPSERLVLLASISAYLGFQQQFSPLEGGTFWRHMAETQRQLGNTALAIENLRRARGFYAKTSHAGLVDEIDAKIRDLEKKKSNRK